MTDVYPIYIGGEFCETQNRLKIKNSYTNELVAETFLAGKTELDKAIEKALAVKNK